MSENRDPYFTDESGEDPVMRQSCHLEDERAQAADARWQALKDLRGMIDWLEAHPDVPLPCEIDPAYSYNRLLIVSVRGKSGLEVIARAFGDCRKDYSDEQMSLEKPFGCQKLKAVWSRAEVCERVVVRTEEVPEQTIPEQVIPARVEPAHVREVVEWRCPPILASDDKAEAA